VHLAALPFVGEGRFAFVFIWSSVEAGDLELLRDCNLERASGGDGMVPFTVGFPCPGAGIFSIQ
jgi:hypothetical protein